MSVLLLVFPSPCILWGKEFSEERSSKIFSLAKYLSLLFIKIKKDLEFGLGFVWSKNSAINKKLK